MGDLVWVRIFFPKPLELEIFSTTSNGARFFFLALYTMRDIFSAQEFFPQVFHCKIFSLEISLGNFFLKSPISYSLRDQTPFFVSPPEGNKCRKRRLVSQATHTPSPSKVKWSAPNLTSASGHHSRVTVILQRHNFFSVVVSETFGGKQFCRQMSCDIEVTNESGRCWRKNSGYITIGIIPGLGDRSIYTNVA